jgi:hypothetical protein
MMSVNVILLRFYQFVLVLLGLNVCLSLRLGASRTHTYYIVGFDVTILDAAANPGGLSAGWRTKEGKAVEAGMKGFWYQVLKALPARCCGCY